MFKELVFLLGEDNTRLYSLSDTYLYHMLHLFLHDLRLILPYHLCELLIEVMIRTHTFARCNLAIPLSAEYF